ncbi:putative endo-exoxylanase [Lophiotrema nucula]|uniref:Putative endo-exoxylanase n=1 Tax=Lophiotrema nucula TaxID=690887 RepID=A0A6A5ZD77_9PLEO|nr:putative endo-exoxylanase [Lophiotrema nucula]
MLYLLFFLGVLNLCIRFKPIASAASLPIKPLPTTVKVTVDTQTRYQTVDGFGVSEAFQRATYVQGKHGLSPVNQQRAMDLLFSNDNGAGLSILRNGIGSSPTYDLDWMKSIAPVSPGSPNATAKYEWDGDDAGQVWLTKGAIERGANLVYANAWSAPGYMKTNGNDSNGGYLCGVRATNCSSGDWRQAYADYLVQLLRFYQEKEGIAITHLGFVNEPDLNQTYASMFSDGFQAADFLGILRPTLAKAGLGLVQIVCCEATGWSDGADLLAELQSVPGAEDMLDIYSVHGYSTNPTLPLNTSHKVWQTEWADLDGKWNPAWDNLGKDGEGISWANKIQQAFTLSNVSGFLYWIGAEQGDSNSALVHLQNDTVAASGRLWAFAQFSRFVKPGAIRLDTKSSIGYVGASAFVNVNGGNAIQVINNGHVDVLAEVEVQGVDDKGYAGSWITNNENDLTRDDVPTIHGVFNGLTFNVTIPKRSMMSFLL